MAKKFTTEHDFKHLTFDEAVDYLSENGTAEEKSAFKKACYTKADGEKVEKLNWLNGKRWFCDHQRTGRNGALKGRKQHQSAHRNSAFPDQGQRLEEKRGDDHFFDLP